MSNKKIWKKIKIYKYKFKCDKLFKSYWIRKLLNKLMLKAKLDKCERYLYDSLLFLKKNSVKFFTRGMQEHRFKILIDDKKKKKKKKKNEKKKGTIKFLLSMVKNSQCLLATQQKRMGKYWHRVPTVIRFPRSYNYGLKLIASNVKHSKLYYSFSQRLKFEFFNILFLPEESLREITYLQDLDLVYFNIPYAHFRWK